MGKVFVLNALAIAAAFLASCETAEAQQSGVPGLSPIGPAPGKRFTATAGAQITYEDNAAGGSQGLANLRGLTPQDTTYVATLSAALQQPIGSQIIFLQTTGELNQHQNNPTLNSQNIDLLGGLVGHLGACTGGATMGYSRRLTPQSELIVTTIVKNTAETTTGNAQVNCIRGHLLAGLFASYSGLRNSARSSGYVNSENMGFGGALGYASRPAGNISLITEYNKTSYGAPAVPGVLKTPDFKSYSTGVAYQRKIGLRLSGDTSVFYTSTTIQAGSAIFNRNRTFKGLTANIGLHYKPTGRTGLDIQYNRSVQPSPTAVATYSVSETGTLTGTYSLTSRVSLHLGGSMQRSSYNGTITTASPVGVVQSDRRNSIFGGASLKIGRTASVDLNAERSHRSTDVSAFNENDTRVSLGISNKF